jgi:DNA-binding SARP family transcriptional activator
MMVEPHVNGLRIQLFGMPTFAHNATPITSFRSRSARLLLSALALADGAGVSRAELERDLWPESDPELRPQNLRRAMADVRAALGGPEFVVLEERVLQLTGLDTCDVVSFDGCVQRLNSDPNAAEEAISLYTAPLLEGYEDDWICREREQRELGFSLAVSEYTRDILAKHEAHRGLPVVRKALRLAPYREPIFVAAIRLFAAMNLNSEALSTFEELESMLEEQWGEVPSELAVAAIESLPKGRSAVVNREQRSPEAHPKDHLEGIHGGALRAESATYIYREADRQVSEALGHGDGLVQIRGPRQIGKSSLLSQMVRDLKDDEVSVLVDLQSFDRTQLSELPLIYRALLFHLYRKLELEPDFAWLDWLGANSNFEEAVSRALIRVQKPVCLVLDEVDLLFDRDYAPDVFGLFRAWYNRRAFEPTSEWGQLKLVLAHALEPHLFLRDLNQSPFNVGTRIALRPFTTEEVARFAAVLSLDPSIAGLILKTTAGMPLITRRLLIAIRDGLSLAELEHEAQSLEGPLGEVLRRHQIVLSQHSHLAAEFDNVRRSGSVGDYEAALRLESLGMIIMEANGARVAGSALLNLSADPEA